MSKFIALDSLLRRTDVFGNPMDYQLLPEQTRTWTRQAREVRAMPLSPSQTPLRFRTSVGLLHVAIPYPRIELFAPTSIAIVSVASNTFTGTPASGTLTNGDILITSSPAWHNRTGIQRLAEYHVINATPIGGGVYTFQLSATAGGTPLVFLDGTGLGLTMSQLTTATYVSSMASLQAAKIVLNIPVLYLDVHCKTYNDDRLIQTVNGVLSRARFMLIQDKPPQTDDTLMPLWIHYKSVNSEQILRWEDDSPVVVSFMDRTGTVINVFSQLLTDVPNPFMQTLIELSLTPYIRDASFANHSVDVTS